MSKGSKIIITLSLIAGAIIVTGGIGIAVTASLKDNHKNSIVNTSSSDTSKTNSAFVEGEGNNEQSGNKGHYIDNTEKKDDQSQEGDTPILDPLNPIIPYYPHNPHNPDFDPSVIEEEKDEEKKEETVVIDENKNAGIYTKSKFYTIDELVEDKYINYDGHGVISGNSNRLNTLDEFVLTLPNYISKIDSEAFKGCEKMTTINMTNSLTTIGSKAFYECTNLKYARLPESIRTIENGAFNYSGLRQIYIPSQYVDVNTEAFRGLTYVEKIEVSPDHPTYDSRENCNAIVETKSNKIVFGCKNTSYPESIKTIGEKSFSSCKAYFNITIPKTIKLVETYAFAHCSNVVYLKIESAETVFQYKVFYSCTELFGVTLPDGMEEIPNSFFENCIYLEFINFPSSLKKIGNYAFYKNEYIKSRRLYFPVGITHIGKFAFAYSHIEELGFTKLAKPQNKLEFIGESAFYGCNNLSYDEFSMYSVNLKTIEADAFNGCNNINAIRIKTNLNYIGPRSLDVNYGNGEIRVYGEASTFKSIRANSYADSPRVKYYRGY